MIICININSFNKEFCLALLSVNIPLNKLKNKLFSNFLEKYTKKKMPDEFILRKIDAHR